MLPDKRSIRYRSIDHTRVTLIGSQLDFRSISSKKKSHRRRTERSAFGFYSNDRQNETRTLFVGHKFISLCCIDSISFPNCSFVIGLVE